MYQFSESIINNKRQVQNKVQVCVEQSVHNSQSNCVGSWYNPSSNNALTSELELEKKPIV